MKIYGRLIVFPYLLPTTREILLEENNISLKVYIYVG